ncbi:uncharacterized protein LOC124142132 [Haliotis rufescens]|uniref:uncharacterized protein LOC124142132 n=1 Tax=Haliotis rufescens TaxID=6454 RepID=UPI00201ED1C2|nr:uncharacterized protein LOC124142132 [Haliotis rufescens]
MDAVKSCLFLSLLVTAAAQLWIPKDEPGFVYKGSNADAPVKMDVFLNLLCSDSRIIYEPLLQLADHYGQNSVQLRVHMFPLPYFTYSFYAGKGAFVFEHLTGRSPFDWFSAVFERKDNFVNSATINETTADVISKFADIASSMGMERGVFSQLMLTYNTQEKDARVAWKYGASRGIHSTPMVLVNRVLVQVSRPESLALEDWRAIVDQLL